MPSFCRHNRLVQNCPICSREQSIELRPIVSSSTPRTSGGSQRTRSHDGASKGDGARGHSDATRGQGTRHSSRHSATGLRVRHLERGVEDGYRSPLVPGLKSSADADRLASELVFAAGRLRILGEEPPGPLAEVAAPTGDLEERTWLAFLIAYICPLDGEEPFAEIERVRTTWASGDLPDLDGVAGGPRTAHEPDRGTATLEAYRAWADRAGSQATAFSGESFWTSQRRFSRLFERLALPGLHRDQRFELLVLLGTLGCYELEAGSLEFGGENETTLAAKRALGIGDPLLLDRRATDLALACEIPLAALDLGLHNWGSGDRSGLGVPVDVESDPAALAHVRDVLGL